ESLVRVGDDVVVDTERGPSLAKVVRVQYKEPPPIQEVPLKAIMRKANEHDLRETSQVTMEEARIIASERVEHFKLNMRIMKAEGQFGGNKITVYFSAPGRVDFRDLVKDLASALRARVELKQVGARDEAKLVGGMGICGREYCCSSFLRDFVPVSIKMAKNQNLALNPNKVSGGCGRLLCCLTYENDAYIDLRSRLPALRSRVRSLEEGVSGVVIKTDILNQIVMIETADGRLLPLRVKDIEILEKSDIAGGESEMAEAESWGDDLDLGSLMGSANRPGSDRSEAAKPGDDRNRPRSQSHQRHQGAFRGGAPQGPKSQESRGPEQRGPQHNSDQQRPDRNRPDNRSGPNGKPRGPQGGGGSGGGQSGR
ncbi:MAG: regulatory iron-sulfur-containing complex subunit RicT, partial [Proteobacteria bacterium]|nr:regulatory iron-sulfur-containing complex subunit RicT [Pseudomonadota bacterium]